MPTILDSTGAAAPETDAPEQKKLTLTPDQQFELLRKDFRSTWLDMADFYQAVADNLRSDTETIFQNAHHPAELYYTSKEFQASLISVSHNGIIRAMGLEAQGQPAQAAPPAEDSVESVEGQAIN